MAAGEGGEEDVPPGFARRQPGDARGPPLAFFVLGPESASMAWLQMAIAMLTAMDDDGGAGI